MQKTLANYELGVSEPFTSIIISYYTIYSVELHWILSAKKEMFTDMGKATDLKTPTIPTDLMKKLG
ncbi:hypothetical protein [Bartonella tribocorum]|uniref:hypothetical protein n=1 Tax=Bartonella tribocorum TaxID=85701 RepID=UPI000674AED6|nr:hypothetical protein [Bartonella tribocorum]